MVNGIYQYTAQWIWGGAAAAVLLFIMIRRANAVAATGNKGRMVAWAAAPSLMVIGAILFASIAVNIAFPRIQAALNSPAALGALAVGDALTKGIDYVLSPSGVSGQMPMASVGTVSNNPYTAQLEQIFAGNGPVVTTDSNGAQIVTYQPTATPATPQEAAAQQLFKTINASTDNGVVPVAPASDAVVNNGGGTTLYQVRPGDSMYAIAQRLLGNGALYPQLCRANASVVGPNCALRPGMQLSISTTAVGTTAGQPYVPPKRVLQAPAQSAAMPTRMASTETQQVLQLLAPTPTAPGGQQYIDKFLREQGIEPGSGSNQNSQLTESERSTINDVITAMNTVK
jgi:hypothetical protein